MTTTCECMLNNGNFHYSRKSKINDRDFADASALLYRYGSCTVIAVVIYVIPHLLW